MMYDVRAFSVDPENGAVTGEPRVERIDTEDNPIFADCDGPWEVEDQYLAYWNRLNDSWEYDFPPGKDKVLVLGVEAVR